jgi:hypothetical protein
VSQDDKRENASELAFELGEVTAEEAAEAAELTRLLAGKSGVALSEDAMNGVGLLRLAHEAELSPDAFARIEAEVLAGKVVQSDAAAPVTWRKAWWWLLAATAPAAIALFLVLNETAGPETASLALAQLPNPDVKVLEAQASWVTSEAERPAFEREMRDYRAQVLASLDVR